MVAENTQDPNSDLYIPSANTIEIESYSPSSIRLTFDNQELQDSILVVRYTEEETISFPIEKNIHGYFIDSENIIPNSEYDYSARYITENGQSDSIFGSVSHVFLGVNNLNLDPINENSINVSWEYNIQENFAKNYENLNWKIQRQKYNNQASTWGDLVETYSLNPVSINNYYEYLDDNDINLDDSLKYTISLVIDSLNSEIASKSIKIDFPQLESLYWIPINSSAIAIYWAIDASNSSEDAISSVSISNNFNDENDFVYQSAQSSGYFIDSINNATIPILPNQQIEYQIKWCGLSDCMDSTFSVNTFPVYNMQYVPSITEVNFNGNIISTDAFYIDIFEVHNDIYDNNDISSEEPSLSLPKSNINIQEARNYCNRRSESYNQQNFVHGYSGSIITNELGFRLPTESDWFVAAAVLHDWNGGVEDVFNYTTQVGSGSITCSYGNILNCGDESKIVGSYNGNSDCISCLKSTSPNGLYDCNGNLKEWVEKSNQYPHSISQSSRGVIIGGDFTSTASQSKNSFFIYENTDFEHSTIGFRTIIPAEAFLNSIHSSGL